MLFCVILATLVVQSFGQSPINCSQGWSYGIGYNASTLIIIQNATVEGFPYPYSFYASEFNNGTEVTYLQTINGNPRKLIAGVNNFTNANNNPNFDCYSYLTTTEGNTMCAGYSVISFGPFAWAKIGCYDASSPECPVACTPEYILTQNRTFFAQFYLNNITDDTSTSAKTMNDNSALITHRDRYQSADCKTRIGYNQTNIIYNANFVPTVVYASNYDNGTVVVYDYKGRFYASGKYNISQSTSSNVQCNEYVTYENITPNVQCTSYSITMNGTAIVACTSFNETCPTICSPEFALEKGKNVWYASLALNRVES